MLGWTVIRGVIPRDRADAHASAAYAYLESFGLGFDRNDRSTWIPEKMPHFYKGGLYVNYGVGHEQFIWDIKQVHYEVTVRTAPHVADPLRQDPAVVSAFADIWGTQELIASYGRSSALSIRWADV